MLADDALCASREDASSLVNPAYVDAFHSICTDPNNKLIVVCHDALVVGMLQLTFILYLSHIGTWRCLIESVRIASSFRGSGLGTQFFQWAVNRARERSC
jgi:GNAT superfamily N-acetyltransferase